MVSNCQELRGAVGLAQMARRVLRGCGEALLALVVVASSGCYFGKPIPDERFQRALKLVDEGTAHLREQKLADAKAKFSLASDLAPLAAAVDGLGCVALLEGDFSRAEELFVRAYEMDGTYDESIANLALLMDITGRHERALELYDQYLAMAPDSASTRNNRAALEYDRGERKILILEELRKASATSQNGVIGENVATLSKLEEGEGT